MADKDSAEEAAQAKSSVPFPTVVILTALEDPEQEYVDKHLEAAGAERQLASFGHDFVNHNTSLWSLPVATQHGKAMAGVVTKSLGKAGNAYAAIDLLSLAMSDSSSGIGLVCFCGIAGTLVPPKVTLGSVVVGNQITWRGFDKISGDDLEQQMRKMRVDGGPLNEALINRFRSFAKNDQPLYDFQLDENDRLTRAKNWYTNALSDDRVREDIQDFDWTQAVKQQAKIHYEGIYSWDFVLNSASLRDKIASEDRGTVCIEMESGGIYRAIRMLNEIHDMQIKYLPVRGISDLCSRKSDDVWREIASDNAAGLLINFLRKMYFMQA